MLVSGKGQIYLPYFFSRFVNDFEDFLWVKNIDGLNTLSDELESELDCYLTLFVILYEYDTVLLSES